jgi:hypothetical protein
MIAAPEAPLLAAEARHDEVRNPRHYPPTPDTRTPQADGALASQASMTATWIAPASLEALSCRM